MSGFSNNISVPGVFLQTLATDPIGSSEGSYIFTDSSGNVKIKDANGTNVILSSIADNVLLNGRAGGQIVIGGTLTGNTLTLQGNSVDGGNGTVDVNSTLTANSVFSDGVLYAGGAATMGNTLDVTSTATFANNVVVGGNITTTPLNADLNLNPNGIGTINVVGNKRITNLGDPTDTQDATTKIYTDNSVSYNTSVKFAVRVRPTNLEVNNILSGTMEESGYGSKIITANDFSTAVFDGVTLVIFDRVLVANTTPIANANQGIYEVMNLGNGVDQGWVLRRTNDVLIENSMVLVFEGTENNSTIYRLKDFVGPIDDPGSSQTWQSFQAQGGSYTTSVTGQITSNNSFTVAGSVLNIDPTKFTNIGSASNNTTISGNNVIIQNVVEPVVSHDAVNKIYADRTNKLKVPVKFRTTEAEFDTLIANSTYDFVSLTSNDINVTLFTLMSVFDGQSFSNNDRIALIKTSGNDNRQGIYFIETIGDSFSLPWKLTRISDLNEDFDLTNIRIDVENGTDFAGTNYFIASGSISTNIIIKQLGIKNITSTNNTVSVGKSGVSNVDVKGNFVYINHNHGNSEVFISGGTSDGNVNIGSGDSDQFITIAAGNVNIGGADTFINTNSGNGNVSIGNSNTTNYTNISEIITNNTDYFSINNKNYTKTIFSTNTTNGTIILNDINNNQQYFNASSANGGTISIGNSGVTGYTHISSSIVNNVGSFVINNLADTSTILSINTLSSSFAINDTINSNSFFTATPSDGGTVTINPGGLINIGTISTGAIRIGSSSGTQDASISGNKLLLNSSLNGLGDALNCQLLGSSVDLGTGVTMNGCTFIGGSFNFNTGNIGAGASNAIFFRNSISISSGSNLAIDSNGQVGFIGSTRASKDNILPIENKYDCVEIIKRLEPKTYNFRVDNTPSLGLIAEDVFDLVPEIVPTDSKGEPRSIRYDLLSVILLDVIKKQQDSIENLLARVALLEAK